MKILHKMHNDTEHASLQGCVIFCMLEKQGVHKQLMSQV